MPRQPAKFKKGDSRLSRNGVRQRYNGKQWRTKCEEDGCKKRPAFNFEGESHGVYCSKHKKDGMINVVDRRCAEDGCKKRPSFNFEGDSHGVYCDLHKKDGMINVKSPRCIEDGCMTIPVFNFKRESQGLYCSEHKKNGMIDVINRRCAEDGCKKQPNFNNEGESHGLYCSQHKKDGMIDVISPRCIEDGCKKRPNFNNEGESRGLYCDLHKKDEMIDVEHRRCAEDGCKKRSTFNFEGESHGVYCSEHKKDGMLDIINRRCAEDGCKKQPNFNFKGESRWLYCSEHKKDCMIDLKHRRCEYDCCIFLDNPSLAMFKNYFKREQHICWAAARNQMYDETLTIQEREAIGNYYGFGNVNLVLRQEQAVLHLINATDIGKILRTNSFGHSFDSDPIHKIFGKNKNVEHKKPDYVVLVNKYSIIVIEYDENSSHEKSRARLNQIKDMFHLNVTEEIRNMESYTTSSTSSESSVSSSSSSSASSTSKSTAETKNLLKNIHIIRINGRDDDNEKRVCIKRERKETEGDYTYTKRYFELSDHGLTVVMEATLLLEEIYNQILLDSDDDGEEINLQIYEIN